MPLAEDIAGYATSFEYGHLPADVIHQVKRTVIDTMGCAFGGYASEPAKIAREMAALISSSEPATILCSMQKTSVDLAAFANDVMIRYLDFNDGYVGRGGGHPSDSIAALLSCAEVAHAGGRELVAATVLAYEVYCRFSDAWDTKASGIDHVTMGAIASVAGAGRLLRLTRPQLAEAINILVAGNVALNQTRVGDISNWKACAYANANRNAIFAVQLAARGMTGPAPIFEGRNGFFSVVTRTPLKLAPFDAADAPRAIMKSHFKQFALGNDAQTVVAAALEARVAIDDAGDIAEIDVRVRTKAFRGMAEPEKWRPRNRETADHSLPYVTAVAVMYGTIEEGYFHERHFLHNQALLDLVAKVRCSPSAEADRRETETYLCELVITMKSGRRLSVKAEYHRGHALNPMSDGELEKKFCSLVADMLPQERVQSLLRHLWTLEEVPDIGVVIRMTAIDR